MHNCIDIRGDHVHCAFHQWHTVFCLLFIRVKTSGRDNTKNAIDWTYIFYGLNYQLAAALLAASPRWYLYQALGSNFLWMLPWAIVVTTVTLSKSLSWTYYAIIFGGALVFDFFDVGLTLLIWVYRLSKGKIGTGQWA
ncbi:hypothetical protein N7456_000420 [Penicillium angulare]|uniref:Uncharacterized protein n=1 Tax=Penicillium angulare TaxID=116970 RepID=A0A9W9KQW8_9EURO|nr:hypothetical protein N7456_000420 [Penicillium angulare]